MSQELAQKQCKACSGAEAPLKGDALKQLVDQLGGDWSVVEEHHLEKTFTFDDFKQALDFTNRAGGIAEEQGHHPEICLTYGKATVTLHTHKVDGLTEADFVLAAKIDQVA